jgi:DNA replicative helicase MCM subunit Mcm2 (Cdc46/Mcm family)
MTKNSEARATGAHVSIIGHITKDELRRLLTETESANGFGNRFLWAAVHRSKCLPEGGNIHRENLNDLVMRLHKAIEFAPSAGGMTRSEGARELWCNVYPELSEGKPGLLGAITARAEAQVMRLSAIYALLDCSTKIEVEHHRAALALWNYCERSARWIFTAYTGDIRADRILLALRLAGGAGMTQTEISERVFHRNVSSNALSAALRILRQSGQARFTMESTGGAPRKRWFATDHV